MVKHLIGYVVPLLILALSIPMILDRVPPNGAYGFRTPKTLESEAHQLAAVREHLPGLARPGARPDGVPERADCRSQPQQEHHRACAVRPPDPRGGIIG